MAFATIDDLRRVLRSVAGGVTIGDEETDTLSYDDADDYLDAAYSQVVIRTGLDSSITDTQIRNIAKRLECLYVVRMLDTDIGLFAGENADDRRAQLEKEIAYNERLLLRLSTPQPTVERDDLYDPEHSLYSLPTSFDDYDYEGAPDLEDS